MSARKRSRQQREVDLALVARLWAEGNSVREIAGMLAAQRDYRVSFQQISMDVRELLKRWRKEALDDIEDRLTLELQRLGNVEREAWRGWRKSLEDAVTRVSEDTDDGHLERLTTVGQAGDPRFLQTVLSSVEKRARLLGLDDNVINLRIQEIERLLGEQDQCDGSS